MAAAWRGRAGWRRRQVNSGIVANIVVTHGIAAIGHYMAINSEIAGNANVAFNVVMSHTSTKVGLCPA